MLEHIKIILLFIACIIILLTLFKLRSKNVKRDGWSFLLSSFFVTLFLTFIIEVKLHHILRASLNIPNTIIYFIYFVIVSYYFFIFRKMFLQHSYILIIISFLFFGLASVIDLLIDGKLIILNNNEIVEDAFHILGAVFWLLFFINFSTKLKSYNSS